MTATPQDFIRDRAESGNLNAYYYSFESTGNQAIDRILAAVAYAGKAFHHTEDWGGAWWSDEDEGPTMAELIQEFANEAAGEWPASEGAER